MDINQVKFGSYSIGNSRTGAKEGKKEAQEAKQPQVVNEATNQVSADKVYEALNFQGLQNLAQINVAKKEVNPEQYLTEDRIKDIEAMMGKFDDGVNKVANTIDAEFPGFFEEDAKLALAAQIFAQEQ